MNSSLTIEIWPITYRVGCIVLNDGYASWQRNKPERVAILAYVPIVGESPRKWINTIPQHYAQDETVESSLHAIAIGTAFMDAVAHWSAERRVSSPILTGKV